MIRVTKLNHQPFAVNADLIKLIEQAPDTVLTLITGEKLVVRESADEVIRLFTEFRRSILIPYLPNPHIHDGERRG